MQEFNELPMQLDEWLYDLEKEIKDFKFAKPLDNSFIGKMQRNFKSIAETIKASMCSNDDYVLNTYNTRVKISKQYLAISRVRDRVIKTSKKPCITISKKRLIPLSGASAINETNKKISDKSEKL